MSAATLTSEQADAQVLAAADELFYSNGVAAVTMATIRDAAGVSLRRLYSLYPSKSELITGWLNHRHLTWSQWFESQVEQSMAGGNSAADAVFDVLAEWLHATNYRGCGFINTLIEMPDLTDEHRSIIEGHKAELIQTLARVCHDPVAMGVLIDGAIVQSAIFRSLDPVAAARRVAAVMSSPDSKKASRP